MAFIFPKDRVRESSTTTGLTDFVLGGAVSGFNAFSTGMANNDTTVYAAVMGTEWEIGIGTWVTGGTLQRTTIKASTNGGAKVSFSAGTKDVFMDVASYLLALLFDSAGASLALPLSYLDTDGTLAANSDSKVASQKAVKTAIAASFATNDAMIYRGATDCSSNPNYPAADRGDTYRVSVAGKIGGASGVTVDAGDFFICSADGTASGNQATVGSSWAVVNTNLVNAYFAGGTDVPVTDGGTGASDAATALSNLGGIGAATTNTLTNKRVTPRVNSLTSSATPTTNTNNYDVVDITALAAAITSMTTNLSGTPTVGQKLLFQIKDNGTARAITWGASFLAKGADLPTTTVISKQLTIGFIWNGSVWGCVAVAQEA